MDPATLILIIGGGVFGLVIFAIIIFGMFFMVKQQYVGIVERFGKFKKLSSPGLRVKIPLVDNVVHKINMRIRQLDVPVETKTKDNVFVKTQVSVQFHVLENDVYTAFYKLNNPESQIESYVFDVVRAEVPKLDLDDVFEKKDDIANAIKSELSEVMEGFGYGIVKALVTDIDPDQKVKDSMNEINAARRLRMAAQEKAEAEKIMQVKGAEAEAESKKLQGQGIADQRKAIIDGLQESVHHFRESVDGATAQDVMTLVLMTQYFDTLHNVAQSSRTATILMPNSPDSVKSLSDQIRESIITANEVSKNTPVVEEAPKESVMPEPMEVGGELED